MQPTRTPEGVRVGGDARQRLHHARGYGRPVAEHEVLLAPVEAAYLLYRGDLSSVDGSGFREFVNTTDVSDFVVRFLAYKDLRERGFYLRPTTRESDRADVDLIVFERGSDPASGAVAHEVRVVDEQSPLFVEDLQPGVLAIVDDEGEVGYVAVDHPSLTGTSPTPPAGPIDAELGGGRVLVWEPPDDLYRACFFGQPLGGRDALDDVLQLSLVEAAYLVDRGVLDVRPARDELHRRAREIEGDRFDRRFVVYTALRAAGLVPKTGYKFGASFRLYRTFESVENMPHSDDLVRVLDPGVRVSAQDLALDVRLAHGVGKRMVFALTTGSEDTPITWTSIERLTP